MNRPVFQSSQSLSESLPAGAVTHCRDFGLWQNGSQARSESLTRLDQASGSSRRNFNDGRMLKLMLQEASDALLLSVYIVDLCVLCDIFLACVIFV